MPVASGHPFIPPMVVADLCARTDLGAIRHVVAARVAQREQVGIGRYGTSLQPWNGRDALRDLDDELVDACQYARQAIAELDDAVPEPPDLPRLRALYGDLLALACVVADLRYDEGGQWL